MFKTLFVAAALLSFSVSARAISDDAFADMMSDINDSVAKVVAAQARRSQIPKPDPKTVSCTPAQVDAAYAALPVCEASIKKAFGADIRGFNGSISKGFIRGGVSLVLLTTTDAYFYHEDCDICAAVDRCSLKDGVISGFKTAHSVGCSDLAPVMKKNVAYSACPLP